MHAQLALISKINRSIDYESIGQEREDDFTVMSHTKCAIN